MEAIEAIFKRRSVRDYVEKEIEDEKIEILLKAAMYAPSAGNEQPWHFIVVKNRTMLNKLAELYPYAKMLKKANAAIVVCADKGLSRYEGDFWVLDCSASTQNILLAATALGIGSVWIGVHLNKKRIEDISRILELPESVVPVSIVSLGYPKGDVFKELPERFRMDRIHYENW